MLFMVACRWADLWRFCAASHDFGIKVFEYARRWGLKCRCCEHLYRQGVKPHCVHASRRLDQARAKVDSCMATVSAKIQALTPDQCDGSLELMRWLAYSLKCSLSDIREKFGFLKIVPWRFSECDDPVIALDIIAQVDSRPLEQHDPLTIKLDRELREDLIQVSMGMPPSERLMKRKRAICNNPLDENKGEGSHIHTNLEQGRATNARLPCIKGSVRHFQVLRRAKSLMKVFGARRRAGENAEHKLFTRILRVKKNKLFKNVLMNSKAFYRRIYRMDDKALEDWDPLVHQKAE